MNPRKGTLRTHTTLSIPYLAFVVESTILKTGTGISTGGYIEHNYLKMGW
jgi:hypothetical protein